MPLSNRTLKAAAFALSTCLATAATAEVYNIGADPSDRQLNSDGSLVWVGQNAHRVGGGASDLDSASVHLFQLPTLGPQEVIVSASFATGYLSLSNNPAGNVDLYGLDYKTAISISIADYFQGAYGTDSNATPIEDDFLIKGDTTGVLQATSVTGSTNLLNYLLAQYTAGADAGDYVGLRLNSDVADVANFHYFTVASASSVDVNLRPVLTIQTAVVPEPSTVATLAGAAALLAVYLRRRR